MIWVFRKFPLNTSVDMNLANFSEYFRYLYVTWSNKVPGFSIVLKMGTGIPSIPSSRWAESRQWIQGVGWKDWAETNFQTRLFSLIDLEPFRSKANPTIFLICLLGSKINDFYPGFSHFNFQRINPSSKISTLQHITRSIYMYNIYTYSIYVYSIHMFGNCNSDWHGLPSNWATNMNSSGGSNHMRPSILVVGSS